MAERDTQRGVMDEAQSFKFASNAQALVANLKEIAEEEEEDNGSADDAAAIAADEDAATQEADEVDLPDGEGRVVLCVGGRSGIDDAAAAMLGQVLEVQGAEVKVLSFNAVDQRVIGTLQLGATDTVVIAVLNSNQIAHARHIVRRLKRMKRDLRVGLLMPGSTDATFPAEDLNADFVGRTVADAVTAALSDIRTATRISRPRLLASPRSFRKRGAVGAATAAVAP
jgi:fructoselysine-6-P-deglycase FrlB-like protein